MTYQLPDLHKEAIRRTELLVKAKNSVVLQWVEIEMCKRDILYWFKTYAYTDRNMELFSSDEANSIPFIPFPFQEELITEIWASIVEWTKPREDRKELTNVFLEKSKQMGVSWVVVAIFIYWFIFHNHKYLMITQKEDDMDKAGDMKSLFEKARFIIRNIPSWMLPKWLWRKSGTEKNKFASISREDWTGSITGESANPNASRWGTYTAIFLDEFAFTANASSINRAAATATPCRIFNSTPNWEWNEHYRMRKLTMVRKWSNWEILQPEIKWLRYHWTEHPLYDKEWYKWRIRWMSKESIAQELEIDYNTAIVWRVYADFPKETTDVKYNPDKPLYIAMDNSHGWKNPFALICVQPDWVYWNVIDSIKVNCTPENMASFLTCEPKHEITTEQYQFLERYRQYNWRRATFISDPYDTKVALWNSTILEDFRKVGINLQLPQERRKSEQILITRTNLYKVRYNDYCLDWASSMMNSRYPERKEWSNSTTVQMNPVHDDQFSDDRTASEYFFTYVKENPLAEKKKIVDDRPRRDYRTWALIYTK